MVKVRFSVSMLFATQTMKQSSSPPAHRRAHTHRQTFVAPASICIKARSPANCQVEHGEPLQRCSHLGRASKYSSTRSHTLRGSFFRHEMALPIHLISLDPPVEARKGVSETKTPTRCPKTQRVRRHKACLKTQRVRTCPKTPRVQRPPVSEDTAMRPKMRLVQGQVLCSKTPHVRRHHQCSKTPRVRRHHQCPKTQRVHQRPKTQGLTRL